jgi:hypothetical protein
MVRHHYRFDLIKRRFPPTNLAMFHTTHAVSKTGILRLQDIVANRLGI